MIKLRYLIEKNYIQFKPWDVPADRSEDIIHSKKNIFPVTDMAGKLVGIVYSEQLFEAILDRKGNITIKDIMQPVPDKILNTENMMQVMAKMDKDDIWILPVVDADNKYIGFVSKTSIFNKYRALLLRQKTYME